MKKVIIILGPPCSGKGTQSKILSEKLGALHMSTGDLIRKEIAEGTQFGNIAKSLIDRGEYVPDTFMMPKIKEYFINNRQVDGYILDGLPRTVNQAKKIEKMLYDSKQKIDKIFFLDCPDYILNERMKKRNGEGGRNDDDESVFNHRLSVYKNETAPVVSYFGNRVIKINGNQTIEKISEEIQNSI